jgi:hypothetical protein
MSEPSDESPDSELACAKTIMSMPVASLSVADGESGDRGARGSRLLACCDQVERLIASRRMPFLSGLVFLGGMAGPSLDWLQGNPQPVWTVLVNNAMLVLLWAALFGWLGAVRDDAGAFDGQAVMRRCKVLWRALLEGYQELRGSEPRARWSSLGAHLVFAGGLLFIVRGITIVIAVSLGSHETVAGTTAGLLWLGSAYFGLGVMVLTKATFGVGNASPEAAQRAKVSLAELPAIIDLTRDAGRQFGDGDPLCVTLSALAHWRARQLRSYTDVVAYQLALERLLRLRVGNLKCRREVWLGRGRANGIADLVLGRLLLIQVARGFSPQNASRAIDQIRLCQRKWPSRPKLLVVFDASQCEVFEKATVAALQSLREEASTITVRM